MGRRRAFCAARPLLCSRNVQPLECAAARTPQTGSTAAAAPSRGIVADAVRRCVLANRRHTGVKVLLGTAQVVFGNKLEPQAAAAHTAPPLIDVMFGMPRAGNMACAPRRPLAPSALLGLFDAAGK